MIQYITIFGMSITFSVAIVMIAKELSLLKFSVDSLRNRVACGEDALIRLNDKLTDDGHQMTNREKLKEIFGIDFVFPELIGIKYDLDGRRYAEAIKTETWLDKEYKEPTGSVSTEKISGNNISIRKIKYL